MLPKITRHPEDQDKVYGDKAVLMLHTSGPDDLTYCWIKNGKFVTRDLYSKISVVIDSPALQIEFFLPEYEGMYTCAIISKYGLTISDSAYLKGK